MPLFDVRSPAEFAHGHVPGAVSLPLFSDAERAEVGTVYKQQSPAKAVRLGLKFAGARMADLVAEVDARAKRDTSPVEVYCWRGGQRSGSVAWLLRTAGYEVERWEGGYKAYRHRVLESWAQPRPYVVLAGLTGSGKTEVLRALHELGGPVLDLEGLAHHKGSAFGQIGELPQPTNEQFENDGALRLAELDGQPRIWIEDESRSIGRIWLQQSFFDRKKQARVVLLERSLDERIARLVEAYGLASRDELAETFGRIAKRLGDQNARQAIEHVHAGNLADAARIALHYYDRTYSESVAARHETVTDRVDGTGKTDAEVARELLSLA
ncbi:MAG: tRNA 2-selenouridine(34) synthase MnmH [Schleiferiaceae bacterium]